MEKQKKVILQGNELFAISPIKNCSHIQEKDTNNLLQFFKEKKKNLLSLPCQICQSIKENWVCLSCNKIYCSRYVNQHMVLHNKNQGHPCVFSITDGSFWCYECNYYITNQRLDQARVMFSKIKFNQQEVEVLGDKLKQMSIKQDIILTKQKFIQNMKNQVYKKIIVLTGAGISVSAGIPDFRTPGTGLYSQLAEYNLPNPQCIFQINYFKTNPHPFYKLSKQFINKKLKPVISHKFINELNNQGILLKNFTQNIDGLELEAGLPTQKLLQSHGHFRTAHCINCHEQESIQQFIKSVNQQKILKCKKCNSLVKPDIVFFGQQMPKEFFSAFQIMNQGDLVIIMGTSLVVYPFSYLVKIIKQEIPIVLFNRENTMKEHKNFLFFQGELDKNLEQLVKQLKWDIK